MYISTFHQAHPLNRNFAYELHVKYLSTEQYLKRFYLLNAIDFKV